MRFMVNNVPIPQETLFLDRFRLFRSIISSRAMKCKYCKIDLQYVEIFYLKRHNLLQPGVFTSTKYSIIAFSIENTRVSILQLRQQELSHKFTVGDNIFIALHWYEKNSSTKY